ncbi:hypothetical protein ACFPPD_18130 [Cohnella suwonensis]|uniref:IDEAL domain-containing protein n=1 Tax=Cohnella suwonensis TaxID=696072 RepID=A0ABW0LXP8_9BACL
MNFEVSDWVQAKTRNGEFVHGFIESFDDSRQVAKLFVVRSDNELSVGQSTTALVHWLRKLPTLSMDEPVLIRNLIDIALATRDETWFEELSERLGDAKAQGNKADMPQSFVGLPTSNRLRHKV